VSEGTSIEWADDSWNPIRARNRETGVVGHYCVKISPGCKQCYAEALNLGWPIYSGNRYAAQDRDKVELFLDEAALGQPVRKKRGRDIFPCSMTDLFLDQHSDEWLERIFDVMYRTPRHRYLVLTKRARRMHDFIVGKHGAGNNAFAFENVWFGVSAENEDEWCERAPYVGEMRSLGFNTWASFEPLLTDIDIGQHRVGWAVIGGESGPAARPTVIGHIRRLLQTVAKGGAQ
jgi:protein gp37